MLRASGAVGLVLIMVATAHAAPIHDAAAANDVAAITALVEGGVAVDSLNETGETALIVAAKTAEADAVNILLHHRADPNFVDPGGRRALHWVVLSDNTVTVVNCIRFLYEKLADMNARDAEGATALILAARTGDATVLTLLLSGLGVDLEIADNAGMTALTYAGLSKHKVIVTIMLRKGAACQTIDAEWHAACVARKAELGLK
jgi:ankyrin repeat protein